MSRLLLCRRRATRSSYNVRSCALSTTLDARPSSCLSYGSTCPVHTWLHLSCISTPRSGCVAGESDPGAQQVLAQHFPGKLLLPDVKAIQSLPEVCSPFDKHSITTTTISSSS